MYVLGEWEPSVPSSLAVVDEDTEVLFKPLIRSLRLAISLGVISGAYILFDVKNAAEFLREMRCEAGIPVCDDFAGGAVMWKDVLNIEVSDGGGGGRFMARDENSSLRTVVIRDGEDAVEAIGERKLNNEIHSDGLEGEGGVVGCDGAVGDTGARGVDLGGLTGGAASDVGGDKGLHVGPPVILGDEETGFEDAWVAGGGGIVV